MIIKENLYYEKKDIVDDVDLDLGIEWTYGMFRKKYGGIADRADNGEETVPKHIRNRCR